MLLICWLDVANGRKRVEKKEKEKKKREKSELLAARITRTGTGTRNETRLSYLILAVKEEGYLGYFFVICICVDMVLLSAAGAAQLSSTLSIFFSKLQLNHRLDYQVTSPYCSYCFNLT